MNLLTNRKSPIRSVFSMEPDGIRNAWTTKVRMNNVRTIAKRNASAYSRTTDFLARFNSGRTFARAALCSSVRDSTRFSILSALDFQKSQESFLRDLDRPQLLHPFLAFLLLFQK